jgi:hypothetical protein
MRGIHRDFRCCFGIAAVALAAIWVTCALAFPQGSTAQGNKAAASKESVFNQVVKALPPGGAPPRMPDGHVDLSGRYYPNSGGKMLDSATPGEVDRAVVRQFDPKVTPEPPPAFKPGMGQKYKSPVPYGVCDQAGTPSTNLQQRSQHAPMELIQTPGRLVMLYEYPLDVRMIYMNGRVHPKDPDPTFNGDSTAHWEGDTLVVDAIAIDERLGNIGTGAVGEGGSDGSSWLHSDREHVIERFSRPSKNYLIYQVTIEDPVVLAKPWKSAPHIWTLAQDPDDVWTEVFCSHNEEPEEYKKLGSPPVGQAVGQAAER